MAKDWGSQVEEEKEKGRIMQTRAKDTCNSRYYIICKMKQLLQILFDKNNNNNNNNNSNNTFI